MSVKKKPKHRIIAALYKDLILNKYREQKFWILWGFMAAFLAARVTVHFFPHTFFRVGHTHIHHYTYGIILLSISGYLAITRKNRAPIWLACLYGIGLGLAVDETGLWLRQISLYHNRQSFDALVIVIALLINTVYFSDFWNAFWRVVFRRKK